MNQPQLPSIELIQGPSQVNHPPPGGRTRRLVVFFTVLLLALAIGLTFVYSRSPVYRAGASVLTVKPKAVDRRSAEADPEHTVIQGRLLMGESLLGRLQTRLAEARPDDNFTVNQLRNMLAVVPVPDTNLLELRADGGDPQQLQRIVNSWAEAYETFRVEEIAAASGRTVAELEDEQDNLQARIESARSELQTFRAEHDIVSLERSENRSLASLKGLNDSLNKARERLIEAEARKAAIAAAIDAGEKVIPEAQKAEIGRLQLQLQRTRLRLSELRTRFTDVYIESDPATRDLPQLVRSLESELRLATRLATETASEDAQQAVEAARLAVEGLEQKLDQQQERVQTFTEHFKEFKRLEKALAELERLYTGNETRLAQIEVRNLEKYPPIQVVEWARIPDQPIYPDYQRDLLIALAAALALALFITWLIDYLSASAAPAAASPTLGVRIVPGNDVQALTGAAGQERLTLRSQGMPPALATPGETPGQLPGLPRELAPAEVHALLAAGDGRMRGYAVLLLNGVSPYELPLLHAACFDAAHQRILVPGACERAFDLDDGHWRAVEEILEDFDIPGMPLRVAELNGQLAMAASGASLAEPQTVDALALWHSYVSYLVRQGTDSDTLTARVGAIPPEVLQQLRRLAPPGGDRPSSTIAFAYPALPG